MHDYEPWANVGGPVGMGGLRPELTSLVTEPKKLGCYDGTGRKKNDRFFSIDLVEHQPVVTWKVKTTSRRGKSMVLRDVHDDTRMPTARQIFKQMDTDGSGSLNEQEVAALYRISMGEKLSTKRLKEAMQLMDTDHSGVVCMKEFETWWDQVKRDLDQVRDRAFALELGNAGEPAVTKRVAAPDIRSKNLWVEACSTLLGKTSAAKPETEETPWWLSLPHEDVQPVREPEPEPEPEPELAAPEEVRLEPKWKWAQKWSVQHQRWYWTHTGTGQASWLKEAEMTWEETQLLSTHNPGLMQIEPANYTRASRTQWFQHEYEVAVQAQRRLDALYFAHTGHSRQSFQERNSLQASTTSVSSASPATSFTKVLADSSGAFSPASMTWSRARMSRATPAGLQDRPKFIGWATWAQDALADSDVEQGIKMDRAARTQHPGTRAATYEEYSLGRIVGLPAVFAPQCHDHRAPQYFPERSMLHGWLILKGPGNEADRFAQCKDGHMLKYTAYGAALDGRQNSSGAFSGPRVTMCVACCVRVVNPAQLCSLCKTVEDAATKESELLGHTRHEHAAETVGTKTPAHYVGVAGTEADATGHEASLSQTKAGHPPPPPDDISGLLSDLPPEKERERARERQRQRQRSLPDDLPPGPPDDDQPGIEMDAVEEIFHRFNTNNDGLLDMEEVRTLLEIAGFEVTDEYIHGLSSLFAKFDEDNSGGIELPEFRRMYDGLGLEQHAELLLGA